MENFIVSARKYRPATFDTVVGQKSITNTLKNAIKNKQLAQAFLFCGPRGVGKTTCARILAKTINCQNITENIEACNECVSCKSFNQSASFNIHELDAASNNSVDDIRNLVDQVRVPPQVGNYKVYIIDEVHMLSQSAFNAFLKTLEEPPAYAKFILATTEKHKIIPTILSRCQIFDFKRITVEDIAKHLHYVADSEHIKVHEDALHIIAQKADGALRDALSIFDQLVSFAGNELTYESVIQNLNVLDFDYYFKVIHHILKGDAAATLLILNEIIDNGFDGQHFIIGLGEHIRNLLVCKDPGTVSLLEVSEKLKKRYLDQAGLCDTGFLLRALSINNQYDVQYKESNNKRLHIELSLLQMCGLMGYPATQTKAAKRSQGLPKPDENPMPSAQVKEPHEEMKKPADIPAKPAAEKEKSEKNETPAKHSDAEEGDRLRPQENHLATEDDILPDHLSIKKSSKMLNGDREKKAEAEAARPKLNNEFTNEQLKEAWTSAISSTFNFSQNLSSSLSKKIPVLKDDFRLELTLDNKVLEREMREKMQELHMHLRAALKNDMVRMDTRVAAVEEQDKEAYFPDEIYKKMVEKNPEINKMRDQLDLEIDF